jgi:hypothetical protein
MGAVNQSPSSRVGAPDVTPGFAVTQALVSLLASHGGTSLTSIDKGTLHAKLSCDSCMEQHKTYKELLAEAIKPAFLLHRFLFFTNLVLFNVVLR